MYQAHFRKSLVEQIISNELPLSSIEQKGLQEFMKAVCPSVHIPSHEVIYADCVQLFMNEKLKLKSFIKSTNPRVCLTLDTWTPNQYVNYLCISAHFIDDNWDKHKKILSLTPLYSDEGEEIGKVVEKCLDDWEIHNVLAITAAEASSYEVAIGFIREGLTDTVLDGEFLHSRCLVDVIKNLVKVALDECDESITRVRAAVLYVRQSSARTNAFKECAKESGIDFKYFMCLDCPTKWIRTFMMLFTSGNYEEAFNLFEIKDPSYKHYMEETCGVPNHDDWENARKVSGLWRGFHRLSESMFGLDATCDKYIHRISYFDYQFCDWEKGADTKTNTMVLKMREKYSKYWENADELNMLICVASVLDPSSKTANIRIYYKHVYNQEDICDLEEVAFEVEDDESDDSLWKTIANSVLDIVSDLFYEYKDNIGTPQQNENFQECLKKRKLDDEGNVPTETELDRYLKEDTVKYDDDFDILLWWKNNTETFPVLSKIAKDVLAIPLSASESAFKAKFGKLVDDFRSSLSPSIVEALVCTKDWRDKSQK